MGEADSPSRLIWRIGVTAAAFLACARASAMLEVPGTNVAIFWPAAGVMLALMWAWGVGIWPGIAVGALVHALADLLPTHAPLVALAAASGEAAADVVPTVLGVIWMRRSLAGDDPLGNVLDVARTFFWGGLVAQALSAAMGVATIWLAGFVPTAALVDVGAHWWASNVVSVAVFGTLLLAWRPPWKLEGAGRHLLVYSVTAGAGLVVFAGLPPDLQVHFRYVTFLLPVAAAFALGMPGATVATALLCVLAVGSVASGHEMLAGMATDRQLLLLNVYLLTLGTAGVLVAAVLGDRQKAEAQREDLREQLSRAQKMESVGRLAGGIAHDLNNLLAPVLGLADVLIEETPRGSTQAEDLGEIKRAAERARDLTRQLLAFGGRQALEAKVVDLRAAISGMERLLRRAIREDVRMEVRAPATLGLVRADVGQLEQVVMNLAVNAQLAMPRGGELTIELADERIEPGEVTAGDVPEGDWVRLSVADTGCGMEPAVLERVFDPFFTTRKSGEGSGLGLSIVHGIVAQHGGRIRAESAPGRGSTFHVLLPRAHPEESPAHTPAPREPRPERASGTVLLAEDDDAVRSVAVRILERLGYRVIATSSADECLRAADAAQGGLDLLLTDVVMPDLNGRELFEKLAASRPGLRVLFMSGYAGDVVTQRGVPLEGLALIQKPFTAEALAEAVHHALSSHPAHRAAG